MSDGHTPAATTDNGHYHAMVGADEPALDRQFAALHHAIYPVLFRSSHEIQGFKIDIDITEAPRFSLRPSNVLADHAADAREALASDEAVAELDAAELDAADIEVSISMLEAMLAEQATLDIVAENVRLVLTTPSGNPRTWDNLKLEGGATATVGADWRLGVNLLKLNLTLPPGSEGQAIVNLAMAFVRRRLRELLADGFPIPPIEFPGVRFAAPVVESRDGLLLAYAAVEGSGATRAPATPESIPAGRLYARFDDAIVNGVVGEVFKSLQERKTERFLEPPHGGPLHIRGEATYDVRLSEPRIAMRDGLVIEGSVVASAYGRAMFQLFLGRYWDLVAALRARADVGVRVGITIDRAVIRLRRFELTRQIEVRIELPGIWIPPLFRRIFDAIVSGLATAIGWWIGTILAALNIELYRLPDAEVEIEGKKLRISLSDTAIRTFTTHGRTVCEAAGVLLTDG